MEDDPGAGGTLIPISHELEREIRFGVLSGPRLRQILILLLDQKKGESDEHGL